MIARDRRRSDGNQSLGWHLRSIIGPTPRRIATATAGLAHCLALRWSDSGQIKTCEWPVIVDAKEVDAFSARRGDDDTDQVTFMVQLTVWVAPIWKKIGFIVPGISIVLLVDPYRNIYLLSIAWIYVNGIFEFFRVGQKGYSTTARCLYMCHSRFG
jgi:hypothetical protein